MKNLRLLFEFLLFPLIFLNYLFKNKDHNTSYKGEKRVLQFLLPILLFLPFSLNAGAVDDSYTTSVNTAVSGNVLDNDSGDDKYVSSNTDPSHGSLSGVDSDGTFTYTPSSGYSGEDSFTYTMKWCSSSRWWGCRTWSSEDATVSITVGSLPSTPPSIENIPDQTAYTGNNFSLDLSSYTTEADGDTISYSTTTLPSGLSLNSDTGIISGTPTTAGTYTVTATASDKDGSSSDTFTIDVIEVVENADDLCYEDPVSSGMMCFDMGICSGGIGCKNTYTLKNIGDSDLNNVQAVYNEDGLGGSFGDSCGVDPSGDCETVHDIDMGPFGVFGSATEFNLTNSIPPENSDNDIWTENFISGSCFNGTSLYGTYIKDGKLHRGKINPCNMNLDESNPRPFTKTNPDTNIYGDLIVIGNQSLCWKNGTNTCQDPGYNASNNDYFQSNANLDSNSTYVNSTMAELQLKPTDKVIGAWLFWSGRLYGSSGSDEYNKRSTANHLMFKTPTSNGYVAIDADKYNWMVDGSTFDYGAVVEVTDLVQSGGEYWVADLQATEMRNQGSGWALAVVIQDTTQENRTLKNISVYDGFLGVYSGSDAYEDEISQQLDGFRTPKNSTVESSLILFASESDRSLDDRMSLTDKDGNEHFLADSLNDTHNLQNGTISKSGANVTTRYPNFSNTLGIDIDELNVSDIIQNDQTETTVTITSESDRIFFSMFGFSTELYIPKLCYDYTLDINGYVLSSINNEINTAFGGFGKPLTTVLYLRSLEGDLDLKDVNITYKINDTDQLRYDHNPCSTEISETGEYDYSDACEWTYDETDAGFGMYIGTGKTSSSGGTISANEDRYIKFDSSFETSSVNTTFSFEVGYTVDYGSGAIPLTRIFNSVDDMCESNNSGFLPELGYFNVVDGTPADSDYNTYNLYTQVSRRPFDLTVYAYDAENPELLISSDLNLSVEVEMIRADDFIRDPNVACNNQHSIMPEVPVKFVHFDNTKSTGIHYDENDINLTYRSAAMRIWYLNDSSGHLIDDHNCTRDNQVECKRMYAISYTDDTECTTECTTALSGCYDCLRNSYGRKVCSRDNFAIRPEAFIVKIYDSNESNNIDNPSNLIPTESASSPAHAIAGYQYRFDINATNHVDTEATPRYVQHFAPGSDSHRVRMQWHPMEVSPASGACNDVADKNITINLFDGTDVNYHERTSYIDKVQQIGEYRFEIFDEDWTSADWDSAQLVHHTGTYSSHYADGADCTRGDSDVLPIGTSGLNGCKISSVHTNPDTGQVYNYHYTRYYPYTFVLDSLTNSIGISGSNPVYINTPGADDKNMTYNIQGTFWAAGKDNIVTSNFVTGCYAEDTVMSLYQYYQHSLPSDTPYLSWDLTDVNTTDSSVVYRPREQGDFDSANINTTTNLTPLTIPQEKEYFVKEMNGTITMDLGYNFTRTFNMPLNSRLIRMVDFNITYQTNPSNLYVDLKTSHTIRGNLKLDENVTFVYGRAKPNKFFYDDITSNSIVTPVSIVLYCDLGLVECQNRGLASVVNGMLADAQTNEADWWFAQQHNTSAGDGNVTLSATNGTVSPADPTAINPVNGLDQTVTVTNGDTTPNIVDIDFGPDTNTWLIYNKDADSIPSPFYRVRFIGTSGGGWTGHGKTGHVVGDDINAKKTKRLEW